MHVYTWQKKYTIGVEALDLQHKNLLTLINKLILYQNEPQGITHRFIDEVIAYAEFHFLSEENLMLVTHYEDYERHHGVHRRLLKQLKNQRIQYENNQCELKEIIVFLAQWLIQHTSSDENDRALAKHLLAKKKYHHQIFAEEKDLISI